MATTTTTVTKTAATPNPSGLTIHRKGMQFTLGWKIIAADHGGGQQVRWRIPQMTKGQWNNLSVGTSATSATKTLSLSDYYPNAGKKKLTKIRFAVRGKRKQTTESKTSGNNRIETITNYTVSAWVYKDFELSVPNRPSLTQELDGKSDDITTFSWSVTVSDADHKPFTDVEYQSILVRACSETDGSKLKWNSKQLGWRTGTGARTGSITITEDNTRLSQDSFTRWVRVRSRGPRGDSEWRYIKHVYATPFMAQIDTARSKTYAKNTTGVTTTCQVRWTSPAGAQHPIDHTTVQYRIDTPEAGRTPPSTEDGWTDAVTVADSTNTDTVQFVIDGRVGVDQCLWARVVNVHDRRSRYSAAVLLQSGALTAPEDVSAGAEQSTARATITATNKSEVPDSRLAVIFRREGQKDYVCGIIPHGEDSVTVKLPAWSASDVIAFGVYAFQGSVSSSKRSDGTAQYAVTANMISEQVWSGGEVPVAPKEVTAALSETEGEVILTWTWAWKKANRAEVSWSQNPHAWESTDEPQRYMIDNTHAAKLRVSGLATGVTWYFCVRLANVTGDDTVYGPYSATVEVNLSSAPETPVLALSAAVVPRTGQITASWSYGTTDGTQQTYAELWEVSVDGETVTDVKRIAKTTTAHSVSFRPSNTAAGWADGTTHYLRVRVTSASGLRSEWSDPVPVTVAEPAVCTITSTSLTTITVPDGDGHERTVTALTAMPLAVTATGAGEGGDTTLVIERAEDYQMERPDGGETSGFAGETIAILTQSGEGQITVTEEDLIGYLDDGAPYRIIVTVQDGLGQSASDSREFEVHWSHQAIMPEATAETDADSYAAFITPTAPDGTAVGDVCDIYRLSADKPELIVQGGTWGTKYVDPYPAIGENGGHRVVFRTVNGDYITADNHPAWIDLGPEEGDTLESQYVIIDFDGDRVLLEYNIDLSSTWRKDFKETKYLGGAVQGDWNPAVSRTGTISTVAISLWDRDTILAMRRLAAYAGVCHVRTPDGSSYAADVQVSESRDHSHGGYWASFTLSVTRVDPEGFDGLPYSQWIEEAT